MTTHTILQPAGWAKPAFDVFQLEDYDWVTTGLTSRRAAAYREVEERLGYELGVITKTG